MKILSSLVYPRVGGGVVVMMSLRINQTKEKCMKDKDKLVMMS